ncbi:MAG: hypothetical protein ACLR6B_20035 [Blautia sp.]
MNEGSETPVPEYEVYENLTEKPDYKQYLFDIKLAVLNEYVEFIEADEDDDRWHYDHASCCAKEILAEKECEARACTSQSREGPVTERCRLQCKILHPIRFIRV